MPSTPSQTVAQNPSAACKKDTDGHQAPDQPNNLQTLGTWPANQSTSLQIDFSLEQDLFCQADPDSNHSSAI